MNYYTALDVSLRSVSICIVDYEGTIQFEAKVPAEVEEIYLRNPARIVFIGLVTHRG